MPGIKGEPMESETPTERQKWLRYAAELVRKVEKIDDYFAFSSEGYWGKAREAIAKSLEAEANRTGG